MSPHFGNIVYKYFQVQFDVLAQYYINATINTELQRYYIADYVAFLPQTHQIYLADAQNFF